MNKGVSQARKSPPPPPRKNAQSSLTLAVVSFSTVDDIEILYPKKPSTLKNDVIDIDFGYMRCCTALIHCSKPDLINSVTKFFKCNQTGQEQS